MYIKYFLKNLVFRLKFSVCLIVYSLLFPSSWYLKFADSCFLCSICNIWWYFFIRECNTAYINNSRTISDNQEIIHIVIHLATSREDILVIFYILSVCISVQYLICIFTKLPTADQARWAIHFAHYAYIN